MRSNLLWLFVLVKLFYLVLAKRNDPSELLGLSEAQLVRQRGFKAEEHKVITPDGYILSLVRVLNPLINHGSSGHVDKRPILFVPGESCLGGYYFNQVLEGEPKDLSRKYDLKTSSIKSLVDSLKGEPLARSLPFLAACFGFESWVVNRRGTPGSLGHILPQMKPYKNGMKNVGSTTRGVACCSTGNRTSKEECPDPVKDLKYIIDDFKREINPDYWNYSLDEQALIDMPSTIDYILRLTKKDKVDIVGHSTGSAIIMMMLTKMTERANSVSTMIHLGPSLYQANATNPVKLKHVAIKSALIGYTGAFSIASGTPQVQCLVLEACSQQFVRSACLSDLVPKKGEVANRMDLFHLYLDKTGKAISSRQIKHLVQMREKGRMYAYDYGERENLIRYGQVNPPWYDVTKLRQNGVALKIFRGRHDAVVPAEDLELLMEDMGFCPVVHFIDDPHIFFNHQSLIFHKEVDSLVMIPALKEIASRY